MTSPNEAATDQSPAELAEARRYGNLRLTLGLIDSAWDVAFLAVAAFVVAQPLDEWLAGWISQAAFRLLAMFVVLAVAHDVLTFPLSWYAGYVVEHRYGLSHESFGRWLRRQAKRFVLSLGFGALLVSGLYGLIWLTGRWWWCAASGAFFVVSVVLGQLVPVLILPLFYKIERLDAADERTAELARRLERLTAGTGLSIAGIYRLVMSEETAKANAMLAGLGRTRRVLLGDTLLNEFSPEEIEVVFAHEVGHHVHRHIPKMIVAGLVSSLMGFWLCDRGLAWWLGAAYDPHHLPVATLPLVMFILTVLGLLAEPLQNLVSRYFERQCDRYALRRTGLTEAYLSAFKKLARQNKADPNPPPLAVFLFHSHPPIAERLALAEE